MLIKALIRMYFCVNMDQYLDVYDEFCIYLELQ